MKTWTLPIVGLACFFHYSVSQATLIDTGFGAIYSTEADITLLKDISYTEEMNWHDAIAWADSLVFHGYDNWRLPSHGGCRNNEWVCTDIGEIGIIYYTELGMPFDPYPSIPVEPEDIGVFDNVRDGLYWFAEDDTDNPATQAWFFGLVGGAQDWHSKEQLHTAWAVADGNVFGVSVTEPSSLILMSLGIAGLGLARIRQQQA